MWHVHGVDAHPLQQEMMQICVSLVTSMLVRDVGDKYVGDNFEMLKNITNIALSPTSPAEPFRLQHRYWWRMLETKCVGDNF